MGEDERQHAVVVTYAVDPKRLASGSWSDLQRSFVGAGDIAASYSADRISEGRPVRRPFDWRGHSWVSVGNDYREKSVQAYRLASLEAFKGEAMSLEDKLARGAERARDDPLGFYNGIRVTRSGRVFVLVGPPARFVAGTAQQLSLFAQE